MRQPENGDVTPTVRQFQFNLAEETLQNVITARICSVLCVLGRERARSVARCATFNSFHSEPPYSGATSVVFVASCPR